MQGIQPDMPAIFTLELWKEGTTPGQYDVYIRSWNNEYYPPDFTQYWLGEDNPLCIRYADYDHEVDNFRLKMFIWGPWCFDVGFCYTLEPQKYWDFTDDGMYDNGTPDDPSDDFHVMDLNGDGVVEFAWGDCVQMPEWDLADNCQFPTK
jgi:hypothetical protein